jgi:NAD(P)-dependent dehydrogenase (short-subunit alcohol dehydrogenase family)
MSSPVDTTPNAPPNASANAPMSAPISGVGHSRLAGRVALVTGGASGLGEAIARRFAAEGATVVVADIDRDGAARVADELGAISLEADTTNTNDVQRMVDVAAQQGPVRVLVLSPAIERRASVINCSDDDWQQALDVNLKGPFLCMKAAIPVMCNSGGGSVIALGSTLGQIVAPEYAAYCASKGALNNLCKQAAIEHAADGIRVNVIAPSATDTGLFMKMTAQAPDPAALRAQIGANMPMKRLGRASEVCDAAVFLASDESSYISGAVLPIDGGLAARRQ